MFLLLLARSIIEMMMMREKNMRQQENIHDHQDDRNVMAAEFAGTSIIISLVCAVHIIPFFLFGGTKITQQRRCPKFIG